MIDDTHGAKNSGDISPIKYPVLAPGHYYYVRKFAGVSPNRSAARTVAVYNELWRSGMAAMTVGLRSADEGKRREKVV
jgi:hypothetical protein